MVAETRIVHTCFDTDVQPEAVMKLKELISRHSLLTQEELQSLLDADYSRNERTREAVLSQHVRQGHLIRVRRGLYAVVPPGTDPQTFPVDPYLVAGKLADDAVLAYHTALEVYGRAHSVFERFFFQSNTSLRPTTFRNYHFQCVLFPKPLRETNKQDFATKTIERLGCEIQVTTLERTLVDLLDRPDLGGGWEEIWRSLERIEYFDLDLVVEYVNLLDNRTTAAKVGYYLQQHAETLMVEDRHLRPLRKRRPKQPHYLERGKSGTLVSDWNLIVPDFLAEQSWGQVV